MCGRMEGLRWDEYGGFEKLCRLKTMMGIMLLFMIVLSAIVFADWQGDGSCQRGTYCDLSRLIIDDNLTGVTTAECNLTVSLNKTILLNEDKFNHSGNGYYNHTVNGSVVGDYLGIMRCGWNNESAISDVSFVVGEVPDMGWAGSVGWLFLFIAGVFLFLAVYYGINRKGITTILVRDGSLVIGLSALLLAISTNSSIISYFNISGDANLANIVVYLNTAYSVLIYIIILILLFSIIDLFVNIMKSWKNIVKQRKDAEESVDFEE